MKTLHGEQHLLLGEMLANSSRAVEGFCEVEAVVEAPKEVGRDDLVERIDIAREQGARKILEKLISFGGRGSHDLFMPLKALALPSGIEPLSPP